MTASFRPALLAAFAAAALITAPAFAQPNAAASGSMAVHTAGLDLASAAGRAALDDRLRRAATAVCGEADARDLPAAQAARTCRAAALDNVHAQVLALVADARKLALASNDVGGTMGH